MYTKQKARENSQMCAHQSVGGVAIVGRGGVLWGLTGHVLHRDRLSQGMSGGSRSGKLQVTERGERRIRVSQSLASRRACFFFY
jgi:hypothetical protein